MNKGVIAGSCFCFVVAPIVVGVYTLNRAVSGYSPWLLAEYRSPSGAGAAELLIEGGLAGSSGFLFVRDADANGGKPLRVGGPYVSDGPVKFERAVWSRDGSVFAVRVGVGQQAGRGSARYDGSFWLDAYDFRSHRRCAEGATLSNRSKAVERLLASRGGAAGQPITAPSIDAKDASLREVAAFGPPDESSPNDDAGLVAGSR